MKVTCKGNGDAIVMSFSPGEETAAVAFLNAVRTPETPAPAPASPRGTGRTQRMIDALYKAWCGTTAGSCYLVLAGSMDQAEYIRERICERWGIKGGTPAGITIVAQQGVYRTRGQRFAGIYEDHTYIERLADLHRENLKRTRSVPVYWREAP